jgi:hypothetical protein
MTFRTRKPANNEVPERRRLIAAKYDGKCSCGTRIATGDLIYYDPLLLKKALCTRCGQRVSKALTIVQPSSEAQIIIDRVRQLEALPALNNEMREEIQQLRQKLISDFLHDSDARTYLFADACLPGRTIPAKAITATRAGHCLICTAEQLPGTTILWDPTCHKILCTQCALNETRLVE